MAPTKKTYDLENPSLSTLETCLLDEACAVANRTRCVFLLRQLGGSKSIDILCKALRSPSILLAHETAFALGQMKDTYAIPMLTECLMDGTYDSVVRHEAAEALGAIGHSSSLHILEKMCGDKCVEVSDTCKIAVGRIKYIMDKESAEKDFNSVYNSVDPAPAHEEDDVEKLQSILNDQQISLFDRYRAMFKLRDLNTEESIQALVSGFNDTSPVLRHEIAYVMGQMQHPAAIPSLTAVLAQLKEHSMVRHEAAEALGAIADQTMTDVLKTYVHDKDDMIRESCEVALDIQEYWTSDQFDTAQ